MCRSHTQAPRIRNFKTTTTTTTMIVLSISLVRIEYSEMQRARASHTSILSEKESVYTVCDPNKREKQSERVSSRIHRSSSRRHMCAFAKFRMVFFLSFSHFVCFICFGHPFCEQQHMVNVFEFGACISRERMSGRTKERGKKEIKTSRQQGGMRTIGMYVQFYFVRKFGAP